MNKNPFEFSRPSDVNHMRAKHRKRRSAERKQDRSDIFLNSRNINESELLELEEDEHPIQIAAQPHKPTKDTDGFAKPKTPVVVKEKKYLNKFIEWKRSQASYKQKELDLKNSRKKPFTTCVKSHSEVAFGSSFAPKNHIFKAPTTIMKPTDKPGISKSSLRNQPQKTAVDKLIAEFQRPTNMKKKTVSTLPPAVPTKKMIGNIGRAISDPILTTKTALPPPRKTLSTLYRATAKAGPSKVVPSKKPAPAKIAAPPTKAKPSMPPRTRTFIAPQPVKKKPEVIKETPTTSKMINKFTKPRPHPLKNVVSSLETPKTEENPPFFTSTVRKSVDGNPRCFEVADIPSPLDPEEDIEGISPLNDTITLSSDVPEDVPTINIVGVERDGEQKEVVQSIAESQPKTPTPPKEKPVSYMSPFVSVSRGKVSAQKEKARRSSIYVADSDYRASMATVERYRKILKDEIERMHKLCDEWDEIKADALDTLTDHAIGMIDTTIGQTRLLTSKKLMQFKSIIDRCEAHALARKEGREMELGKGDAGPTLSEDVEGFWSMVSIQVDQVDRRFTNLNRWKNSNWNDPDEVVSTLAVSKGAKKKTKNILNASKKISKVKKKTGSEGLRKAMMAARAELKKQKDIENREPRRSSSRRSFVLLDNGENQKSDTPRRSSKRLSRMSPFTTKTPVLKASPLFSNSKDNWVESPIDESNLITQSRDLRKSLLMFTMEDIAKTPNIKSMALKQLHSNVLTPVQQPRKSILKTPGTVGKGRNVVFNLETSPLLFTTDDTESPPRPQPIADGNPGSARSYKLRNRKIKLRPSSEIKIPQ